jgi:hypothetical protein
LWRGRYSNCDYGYYVNLGPEFVGHATPPPAPNHGFAIALPDVGRTSQVLPESEERYIWTDATYDVLDDNSLSAAVQSENRIRNEMHGGVRPASYRHKRTILAGVPAMNIRTERNSEGKRIIEETVVAVRSGIVYEVGMVTNAAEFEADIAQFRKVLAGFRWTKLPTGECRND